VSFNLQQIKKKRRKPEFYSAANKLTEARG